MICPECSNKKTYVVDTRQQGAIHKRRYECKCGGRFTTYEIIANEEQKYRRRNQQLQRFTLNLVPGPLKTKRRKKKPIVATKPIVPVLSESTWQPNEYATKLLNQVK